MKQSEVETLRTGVYRLFWVDGGSSQASVGVTETGEHWFAPSNWVNGIPCTNWDMVESVVRHESTYRPAHIRAIPQ